MSTPSTPAHVSPSRITTVVDIIANLNGPQGIAFDKNGNLYIAQTRNSCISKVDRAGNISIFAGQVDKYGYSGDGGPATEAQLSSPDGIAFDSKDNLYIADYSNNRIRMVDSAGKISTVAGGSTAGYGGYGGDSGPATLAQLSLPGGIAFDSKDNLYIADSGNRRIRKVDSAGKISTVAGGGTAGYGGDSGPATEAQLSSSEGIAFDSKDNLYIADSGNNRIRKVDSAGKISTVAGGAGGGTAGYGGDSGPATEAQLSGSEGIAFDSSGNLYIADSRNYRIRMVDSAGKISTVAGGSTTGYAGSKGPAVKASIGLSTALAFDNNGNLYFSEFDQSVIRRVELPTFAVSHNTAYDFGTNPFSVMAVVSPETVKEIVSGEKTVEQTVIATGNIISKYAPYQKRAGGWQLSIVADPKDQPKGTYLSFSVYGKVETDGKVKSCEVLALLTNQYIINKRYGNDNVEQAISEDVFKKCTHNIAAVKDASGECKLYLNGILVGKGSLTEAIDVSNTEPLNIGKLHPAPPKKEQQGGIIRKASLWNKALSQAEIINYMNCMTDPKINFKTELDYKLEYFEKGQGNDITGTIGVRMKGTLRLYGANGKTYDEPVQYESNKYNRFDAGGLCPQSETDRAKREAEEEAKKKFPADCSNVNVKTINWIYPSSSFKIKVFVKGTYTDSKGKDSSMPDSEYIATYKPELTDGDLEKFYKEAKNDVSKRIITHRDSVDGVPVTYQYDPEVQQVYTNMEIWKQNNCVGYWNFFDEDGKGNGQDLSATKNSVPVEQILNLENLQTVLPFYMQEQEQDVWCWAATSVSIEMFYNSSSSLKQCDLVTEVLKDPISKNSNSFIQTLSSEQSCCDDGVNCSYGFFLGDSLERLSLSAETYKPPLTFEECCKELSNGRPMGATISFEGNRNHTVVISGLFIEKSKKMLVINDSWSGITTISFENFLMKYLGAGKWIQTFCTRPVLVS